MTSAEPVAVSDEAQRQAYLESCGFGAARVEALPADASFRRYFRLHDGPKPALLMDCSKDPEPIEDFIRIDEHLRTMGVRAPEIYAHDTAQRYAVIEDFGDDTFTRLLNAGEDPEPLYRAAVDILLKTHTHLDSAKIDLGIYDEAQLLDREVALLPDWYFPAVMGRKASDDERVACFDAWRSVFANLPEQKQTFVMRDFHVDNIMRIQGEENAYGVLDFQIGLIGSPAYDLVSLLEDARREVADDLTEVMLDHYFANMPETNRENFMKWYRVLGAQRHAKVLGIFVRLNQRDGKPRYLEFIPHVAKLFTRALQDPVLKPVNDWVKSCGMDISGDLSVLKNRLEV